MLRKLFKFHGGVKPQTNKTGSTTAPIAQVPLPDRLVIPLHQAVGGHPRPLVQVGDHVFKGQRIGSADGSLEGPSITYGELRQRVAQFQAGLERAGLAADRVQASLRRIVTEVTGDRRGPGGHILTGPVYVEGAAPGDVLEVQILSPIAIPVDELLRNRLANLLLWRIRPILPCHDTLHVESLRLKHQESVLRNFVDTKTPRQPMQILRSPNVPFSRGEW